MTPTPPVAGPPDLTGALLARCTFPPPGTPLRCGVSGGADSLALMILARAAGCEVEAVHVDHGLRPGSDREAAHVAAVARAVGASFRSVTVAVPPGPNLEARARAARHGALGPGAACGHTADDRAETVLLNLLRGTGVDGLAVLPPGPRHPIVRLRRAETRRLCEAAGVAWIEDPSNRDPRFRRNRVRAELLPLMADIAGRDPVPLLCRLADIAVAEVGLLDELAADVDPTSVAELRDVPVPLAVRALRRWLTDTGGHPPSAATIGRVLEVTEGRRRATELPGGRRLSRHRGRLHLSGCAGRRPDGGGR